MVAIDGSDDTAGTRAIVAACYNHAAAAYLDFSLRRPTDSTLRHAYLEKLLSVLPAKSHVLELGCGAGVLCTRTLLERGHIVTAVDISSTQISMAKENLRNFLLPPASSPGLGPQLTLLRADMMGLEFSPRTFNAVVAFYSFFHLPQPDQPPMIRKIASWLKEDGRFLANLCTMAGDEFTENWMGAKSFSASLGAQANSEMIKREGKGMKVVEDELVMETGIGEIEEGVQWVVVVKKSDDRL